MLAPATKPVVLLPPWASCSPAHTLPCTYIPTPPHPSPSPPRHHSPPSLLPHAELRPSTPQLAQLSLQAKRDSGSGSRSTGLLSFFDSWEDLAVASLDLAALANRKEDLGFGTEAGVPPAASIQAGAVVRRHVAWTNPQAEGVGLMVGAVAACALGFPLPSIVH